MKDHIFQECYRYYIGEIPRYWDILMKKYPNEYITKEAMRSAFKKERSKRGIPSKMNSNNIAGDLDKNIDADEVIYNEASELKQDGTYFSDKLVEMSEEDKRSPKRMLELHNLDPELWEVYLVRNNLWHSQRKNDQGRLLLYQSRLTAKPKQNKSITFEDIDRFFENHKFSKTDVPSYSFSNRKKIEKTLEITIPDLHFGKRDIENDKPMEDRLVDITKDILYKIRNEKIDKIIFAFLGDILHFDSKSLSTTHGTNLETNGDSFQETFDRGLDSSLRFINSFMDIAPMEIISVSGNHDYISSYMLNKSIEMYFRQNKHVSCDISHKERKYRKIGNSLLGLAHGNLPKKNMFDWINYEARELISSTKRTELHYGHLHTYQVIEQGSTTLTYLPTISGTDQWSYEKGYVGAQNRIFSFLWDDEEGVDQIWMSYFQ